MSHAYGERRRRAQARLQEQGADAAIVSPGPNLQYFTGFRGEPLDRFHVFYLPADGEGTLLTPEGYLTQVQANANTDAFDTIERNEPAVVADALVSLLPSDVNEILVDENTLHALTQHLYDRLEADSIDSMASLIQPMRRRKDNAEIADLRRSADVADAVSEEIRSFGADAVGMTETDLAREIRAKLHARGATGVSFDVVVGAGPNGADPALRHGDRVIRAGEPVIADFGCFLDGYASDQTRTVIFDGDPPAEFERVHRAVLAALDVGVDIVKPGVTTGDVDTAVREKLAEFGYAERFIHGTGHGVGLAAHEDLAIAEGTETEIEPGMVFSVEPGVYFEDEWGVRIEDLVVVTDDGCERLNDSPRTWKPL